MAYVVAIGMALGLVYILSLHRGERLDLESLLFPVVLAVYLGGFRPAALALGLVTLGGGWLMWEAGAGIANPTHDRLSEWLWLVVSGLVMVSLIEALHRERHHARESERRYAVTLASIGDGVIATERDDRVSFVNREAARLLGLAPEAAIGRPLAALCEPLATVVTGVVDEPVVTQLALTRGAEPLHVEVTRMPIRGEQRAPEGHVVVIRDTTERERQRAELERWADAFTHCAHGIVIGDPLTGTIAACNPALGHLLGRRPSDLMGLPILGLYPPEAHDQIREAIARADRDGSAHHECAMIDVAGRTVPVAVDLTSIAAHDGAPRYRVATIVDVRDRERTLEQVRLQARLLALSFEPTLVWELRGSIRLWNEGAARLYGYDASQALGQLPHRLLKTEDSAGLQARLDALARAGEWSGHLVHQARDGRVIEVESRQQMVVDASGERLVLETNRDVTEARRLMGALADREEKLRLFIDHAPASIAMFDREMRYVAVSRRWLSDYGLAHADLAGRSHYEVFPEITETWKAVHRRALAGEVVSADSDRFERADGSVQWLRWEVRPWHEPSGSVGGIVVFSEDITQAVKAQHAVEESEQRLASVIENLAEGIVISNASGSVTHWNRAAVGMFGFERREDWLLALPEFQRWFVVSTLEGEELPPERWPLSRVMQGEVVSGVEIRMQRRDTPWDRTFSCNGVRVKDPGGQDLAIVSMSDITERKRAEGALAARTADLARSNTDLEQFAYVASHDLKEPLRAVAGCMTLLSRRYGGQLDERADELIRHAVEGSTRMQQLIDDLLAYSRVGTRGARFETIDLADALEAARRNLSTTIAERGAELTADALPRVEADAMQLASVFQNLVGNAIKFCAGTPRIHVSAARDAESWVVSVRDHGIGVAPEYGERIFGVFQRLHTRTEYPGTGIGLAICKKIIERHGGRIWVEPTLGGGSTFRFSLPAPL